MYCRSCWWLGPMAANAGNATLCTALVAAGASPAAVDANGRLPADVWPTRRVPPAEFDAAIAAGLALRADAAARREDAALACMTLHVASRRAMAPPNVVVSLLAALR